MAQLDGTGMKRLHREWRRRVSTSEVNAFLEAVYYRKPLLCNRYTVYQADIEPCGFDVILMDGYVSQPVVVQVRRILDEAPLREAMVEHNYEVGRRFFSFERAEAALRAILAKPEISLNEGQRAVRSALSSGTGDRGVR